MKISIETGNIFYNKEMTFLSFNRYCFILKSGNVYLLLIRFIRLMVKKEKRGKTF